MLRHIYDQLLKHYRVDETLEHYNEIQGWMGQTLLDADLKMIANRYHEHLQTSGIHIRENNLLPYVRKGDKPDCAAPLLPIAIYLDRLRSAFNVGSILRTTEAFALGSVYFAENTPFIDNRQVQNTSMDAHSWIPCHRDVSLEKLPRPIIVMETSPEAVSINQFIFPDVFTLVLGNEEYGCSDYSLKQADYLIEVPLCGKKNSLNVANAFAIAAAEIRRQKPFTFNEGI